MSSPANSTIPAGAVGSSQSPLGGSMRVDEQGNVVQPHAVASGSVPSSTGPTPTGATVEAGLTGAASGVSVTPNSTPPPTGAGEGFACQAGSTPPATQGAFAADEVPTLNADAAEQSGLYPGAEFMLPAEVVTFIRDKLVPTAQYDVSSVLVRHGIVVPELFKNMGDCAELAGSLSCPSNIYALRALGGVFGPTAQTSDVPLASLRLILSHPSAPGSKHRLVRRRCAQSPPRRRNVIDAAPYEVRLLDRLDASRARHGCRPQPTSPPDPRAQERDI